MQIKQTEEKINKEEEDDSESYAMPIFHIPTKAQRKLIQSHAPAQSQHQVDINANATTQKAVAEKSEEKKRCLRQKLKSEKLENKADQSLQQKEGKNVKREFIQKDINNKKEMKIQKNELEIPPTKQRRGRPRKEVKIESQVKKQRIQEQSRQMKKEKIVQKQRQQVQIEQEKQQGQKMQVQPPQHQVQQKNKLNKQNQEIQSKETQTQKVEKKEKIELSRQQSRKLERVQENQKQSSSSQESKSSQSDSSERKRYNKTKKIKMYVSSEEKILIWKWRYIECKRELKKHFFKFRKCPRNHRMRNLIHNPEKSGARLVCQKCKKSLERCSLVYWQCLPCKYLVCAQCEGFNWRKCPYGHPTLKSKHHRGQRTCDVCLQPRYVGGLTCPCNFDMCGDCELKAKGKEVIALQSQE